VSLALAVAPLVTARPTGRPGIMGRADPTSRHRTPEPLTHPTGATTVNVRENLPDAVTWQNWQEHPANRWAYHHMDEVVATERVARGDAVRELTRGEDLEVPGLDDYLHETNTDAFIVVRGTEILVERYLNDMQPGSRHLLQSVSKSMCSAVFARYVADGTIDVTQPASRYVPELSGSAYGEATLQQTLDMTAAVAYDETYNDPTSDVYQHDCAGGWRPPLVDSPADVKQFLVGLPANGEHGRTFQYCSANTDVLALVLQTVTGRFVPDLLSADLWGPMGAEYDALVTVDASGLAMMSGGMCVTVRDLARFGRMVLDGGAGPGGQQVIPSRWIEDVRSGGDRSVVTADITDYHPDGSYKNQFWVTGDDHGCIYCAGIYGQYIWMNPQADVVVARVATQPAADDDALGLRNQTFLDAVSALAGT
jgi:6-aminohexanoate-oligomer exohydrolase